MFSGDDPSAHHTAYFSLGAPPSAFLQQQPAAQQQLIQGQVPAVVPASAVAPINLAPIPGVGVVTVAPVTSASVAAASQPQQVQVQASSAVAVSASTPQPPPQQPHPPAHPQPASTPVPEPEPPKPEVIPMVQPKKEPEPLKISPKPVSNPDPPKPLVLDTSQPSHTVLLRLYCRACGLRNITEHPSRRPFSEVSYVTPVSEAASLIRSLHDVDVEQESEELYPRQVCGICAEKFVPGWKKRLSGEGATIAEQITAAQAKPDELLNLARAHPLADFWAHSSGFCDVCNDPSYSRADTMRMLDEYKKLKSGLPQALFKKPMMQAASTVMRSSATVGAPRGRGRPRGSGGGRGPGRPPMKRYEPPPEPIILPDNVRDILGEDGNKRARIISCVLLHLEKHEKDTWRNLRRGGVTTDMDIAKRQGELYSMNPEYRMLVEHLDPLNLRYKLTLLINIVLDHFDRHAYRQLRVYGVAVRCGGPPELRRVLRLLESAGNKDVEVEKVLLDYEKELKIKRMQQLQQGGKKPNGTTIHAGNGSLSISMVGSNEKSTVKLGKKPINIQQLTQLLEGQKTKKGPGRPRGPARKRNYPIPPEFSDDSKLTTGASLKLKRLSYDDILFATNDPDIATEYQPRPVTSRSGRTLKQNKRFQAQSPPLYNANGLSITPTTGSGLKIKSAIMPSSAKERLPPQELDSLKARFLKKLPKSRAMKADVFRGMLIAEKNRRKMLEKVGIYFVEKQGDFLCPRGLTAEYIEGFVNLLVSLVDVQWAVIMAENIFKLLHARDTWTAFEVGIRVDTSPKTPLFYRLDTELRDFVRSGKQASATEHLIRCFNLSHDNVTHARALDSVLEFADGVNEATRWIKKVNRKGGGMPIVPSLGARKPVKVSLGVKLSGRGGRTGRGAVRKVRKKKIKIEEESDENQDDGDFIYTPRKTASRGGPAAKRSRIENDDDPLLPATFSAASKRAMSTSSMDAPPDVSMEVVSEEHNAMVEPEAIIPEDHVVEGEVDADGAPLPESEHAAVPDPASENAEESLNTATAMESEKEDEAPSTEPQEHNPDEDVPVDPTVDPVPDAMDESVDNPEVTAQDEDNETSTVATDAIDENPPLENEQPEVSEQPEEATGEGTIPEEPATVQESIAQDVVENAPAVEEPVAPSEEELNAPQQEQMVEEFSTEAAQPSLDEVERQQSHEEPTEPDVDMPAAVSPAPAPVEEEPQSHPLVTSEDGLMSEQADEAAQPLAPSTDEAAGQQQAVEEEPEKEYNPPLTSEEGGNV